MQKLNKLKLNKTTVRKLTEEEIKQAQGGRLDCKGTSTYGPSQVMIC